MSAREQPTGGGSRMRLIAELRRPLRGRIVAAVVATIVSTAAALVPPYLAGLVVNNVVATGSSSELVGITVALALALAASAIASGLESWLIGEVGHRALMDLRRRIVAKLHELPMSYFDQASTGSTISRVTNDVEALNVLVSGGLNRLISSVLVVIGTAIVMVLLDWRLALVSLFAFPFLITVSLQIQQRARPAWQQASSSLGSVTAYVQEGLAGRDVIRAFGQEDRHVDGFERANEANETAHMAPVGLNRIVGPSSEIIAALGLAAVIAYGAHEVIGGALEVGIVVSFLAYLRQALAPLSQLAGLFASFQQALTSLEAISELLELPPDPGQLPGRAPAPKLEGAVGFEGVWFAYEGEKWVIQDLDIDIEAGQSVAFVGTSGSGKSTIVKLGVGFYPPNRGRITFDGNDVADLNLQSVREQIGYVPQEPFLFTGTVAENIIWGGEDQRERAAEAARAVGAMEALERLPDGLESEVGERGQNLSIGQRQLVALARATASDPRLLILDEATSNIDTATEAAVQRGIEMLLEGRTSIVVAHRLSTIRNADKIVVLERGVVAESGSPAELRELGGHFAALEREYESDD